MLREVTVKIRLERIDTQEGITVEVLLDRPIYIRNMDRTMNKKEPIENTVEVNIYYQEHRERTEIDVIERQKWNVILGMP